MNCFSRLSLPMIFDVNCRPIRQSIACKEWRLIKGQMQSRVLLTICHSLQHYMAKAIFKATSLALLVRQAIELFLIKYNNRPNHNTFYLPFKEIIKIKILCFIYFKQINIKMSSSQSGITFLKINVFSR